MQRSDKQFEKARPARLVAADQAYRLLIENFAPESAVAIAVRAEYLLAVRWEIEQEQMRARHDPHLVFEISIPEMERERKAFASVPVGRSDAGGEQQVVDLLAQFPLDQAWWTAHRAREKVEASCKSRGMV
ncbi:MAG TPA: hypothetical protein VFW40_04790 [Capsulimonadaceae bacterium]|nr:hypothetical protein [Capsulimonadaceae bacterium]